MAHENIDSFREIYADVLDKVPYNSGSSFFEVAGQQFSQEFGGNCIGQNTVLQKRLKANSIFLRDKLCGRHFPLLVNLDNTLYYSDIYLMAHEPINLTDVLCRPDRTACFDAYPHIGDKKSEVTVLFDKNLRFFRVEKTWPESSRVDKFEYDLQAGENRLPIKDEFKSIIFHPIQKTLSLRTLNVKEARVDHIIYPLNGSEVDKNKLYVKTNSGEFVPIISEKNFGFALEVISEHIGKSNEEIIDFLLQSVVFYNQFKV